MRNMWTVLCLFTSVFLFGCAGVHYSQTSPEAANFHPKSIAVLPATVGDHEEARDAVDSIVSRQLSDCGVFTSVVDSAMVKSQLSGSSELADEMSEYITKLNSIGVSDAARTARLKKALNSDALFLTHVTSWGYGRAGGNKVARVGLGVKLVDASSGTVIWKANHELVEEYWMIRPALGDISDKLLALLLEEMPIGGAAGPVGQAVKDAAGQGAGQQAIEPVTAEFLDPLVEEDMAPVQQ